MTPPVDTAVEAVLVTAQRPGLTALATSILDTPQTITVIPQATMRDQGVATLQDALKSVPGVTLNAGEGGAHGDTINLRGFSAVTTSSSTACATPASTPATASICRRWRSTRVPPRPCSAGAPPAGGQSGQQDADPDTRAELAVTGGTNAEARGTLDVNQPLGEHAAIRLDAMAQRSEVGRPRPRPDPPMGRGAVDRHRPGPADHRHPGLSAPVGGQRPRPGRSVPGKRPGARPARRRLRPSRRRPHGGDRRCRHPAADPSLRRGPRAAPVAALGKLRFRLAPDRAPLRRRGPAAGADPAGVLVYRDRPSVDGVVKTAMSDTQLAWRDDHRAAGPQPGRRCAVRRGDPQPAPLRQPAGPDRPDAAAGARPERGLPRPPDHGHPTPRHAHDHGQRHGRRHHRLGDALDPGRGGARRPLRRPATAKR